MLPQPAIDIVRAIARHGDSIGFNALTEEVQRSTRTVSKYLNLLEDERIVTRDSHSKYLLAPNSEVAMSLMEIGSFVGSGVASVGTPNLLALTESADFAKELGSVVTDDDFVTALELTQASAWHAWNRHVRKRLGIDDATYEEIKEYRGKLARYFVLLADPESSRGSNDVESNDLMARYVCELYHLPPTLSSVETVSRKMGHHSATPLGLSKQRRFLRTRRRREVYERYIGYLDKYRTMLFLPVNGFHSGGYYLQNLRLLSALKENEGQVPSSERT